MTKVLPTRAEESAQGQWENCRGLSGHLSPDCSLPLHPTSHPSTHQQMSQKINDQVR